MHGTDQRFGLDRHVRLAGRFALESGAVLDGIEIGYETYGTPSAEKTNAVLVCHALTGNQHVAGSDPRTGKPGWWPKVVGPERPIDPQRHFVVCANVLGGCSGTTGPTSRDPTGVPYAMTFPVITIRDMVRVQAALLDFLGVDRLLAVVGGSMGRGCRRSTGRSLTPARVQSSSPSPAPHGTRRRTSPSTRSGGRRSWPIRVARWKVPDRFTAIRRPRRRADGGAYHLFVTGRKG